MSAHTPLVYTGVPYLTESAELIVMERDARTRLSRSHRQRVKRAKQEGTRGLITRFSSASWFRAREHLRNSENYRWLLTLTFPTAIDDDREVKRCLDRFTKWLEYRDVGSLWKREFQASGRPHLHLLLTAPLNQDDAAEEWFKITGSGMRPHLQCEAIRNYTKTWQYVLKGRDDPANVVPLGYNNAGRFWGARGPCSKPRILFQAKGTPSEIAKLARSLRALAKSKLRAENPRAKPKRERGISGRFFKDCGGSAIAEAMRRLQEDA